LLAPKLLHRQAGCVLAGKAHRVHGAGHGQPPAAVGDCGGLGDEQPAGGGQGTSVGVVAHTTLADPHGGGAVVGEQHDGLVGDAGAWSEQEHTYRGGRDVYDAAIVGGGDRVAVAVDDAAFEIDKADAVFGPVEVGD